MRPLDFSVVPFLLLAGLLLPDWRAVRLAASGFLLAGLAAASAALVLGTGSARELVGRVAERGVQSNYLVLNAALMLAGIGLGVVALAQARHAARPVLRVVPALALVTAVLAAGPLLQRSRPLVAVLAGMTLVLLALAWSSWSDGRLTEERLTWQRGWLAAGAVPTRWAAVAFAVLAVVTTNLGVTLASTALVLLLVYAHAPRQEPLDRLPVLPVAAVAILLATWLAWRAAGADGLALAGLGDAAFSPALQTLLGALLLPALFALAGVPPFDRFVPGALLAPVAAVLLGRGLLSGLPDAVEHWRSAGALWLVLAAADAVRRHRSALLVACAGLFAILVGGDAVRGWGGVLAFVAALFDIAPATPQVMPPWAARAVLGVALVAWGAALRTALATEVVYSVAMVVVLAAGTLRGAGRPAER